MADIVNHDGGEQAESAELGGQQAAYESGSVYLMYSRDAPVVGAEFQMFSKITDTVGVLYHDHSGETILSRLPKKDIERFAEQAAAEIVEIWKGKMEGEELDKINGSKPLARIAMDWLEHMPVSIPKPTKKTEARSSEAYIVLWLHTEAGRQRVSRYNSFFNDLESMGISYGVSDGEDMVFLQELVAMGQKLYYAMTYNDWSAFA